MGLLKMLFKSDNTRSIAKLEKIAQKIEDKADEYKSKTDAQLKETTKILKERLANGETLLQLLPDAFACVREASERVIGLRHYHVQLLGGIALFQGRIAEMRTGEGKTLVETLPAYLVALEEKGVHIVTVNEYLTARDAEWMGKIFKFLGLTVGVSLSKMSPDEKRKAYECDITYSTNNELGFDYLRDNMAIRKEDRVSRGYNFAIVDEVDSILIDEARTPLIISGLGMKSSDIYTKASKFAKSLIVDYTVDEDTNFVDLTKSGEYKIERAFQIGNLQDSKHKDIKRCVELALYTKYAKKRDRRKDVEIESLVEDDLFNKALDVVSSLSLDYEIDAKEKAIRLSDVGIEKAEKFFGIDNLGDADNLQINHLIRNALQAQHIMKIDNNYIIKDGKIVIVDEFTGRLMEGRQYSNGLHQAIEAKEGVEIKDENKTLATITFQNYFRLYKKISGMTGTAKTEENEFNQIYNLDVVTIPTNKEMIRNDYADVIYTTEEGKLRNVVKEIMDIHGQGRPILVGTLTIEKSEQLSALLRREKVMHKVLNAKNHQQESEIIAQAGQLGQVTIATNMAGRGTDILLGGNPEFMAKQRLRDLGYTDVQIDFCTSFVDTNNKELKEARTKYQEFLAKFKAMTDADKQKVIELGGLHVIGTERHESRRIDNQLRGRAGRQGDPGSSVFFVSMEDDLVRRFGGDRMKSIMNFFRIDSDTAFQIKMLTKQIERAQKRIEGYNFSARHATLVYDDVLNKQRTIIYGERNKVLDGTDVHGEVVDMINEYAKDIVYSNIDESKTYDLWDLDALNNALDGKVLPFETKFVTAELVEDLEREELSDAVAQKAIAIYDSKSSEIKALGIDPLAVERDVMLKVVDNHWMNQIDDMTILRNEISLRQYGQHDPVVVYKQEGFEMFDSMINRIREDIARILMNIRTDVKKPQPIPQENKKIVMVDNKSNGSNAKKDKVVGRNDPCPCGSGRKYKNCCGKQ